jgi:putative ABC transport system ATP-binding protein
MTASGPADPAIVIQKLNHWYGEGAARKQVLFDIDLTVQRGEVVFLMGPSGCGKTTILTLVGALRRLQQGEISVLGKSLRGGREQEQVITRRRIGFIFQAHNLHRSLTALDNVRLGLEAQGGALQPDADERCRQSLANVGLADHVDKKQDKLSGGQRQRVAIARALVANPQIILADEPTAALDSKTGHEIIALIRSLSKARSLSMLMVTHDSRVLDLADRIISMEDGRIIAAGHSRAMRQDA